MSKIVFMGTPDFAVPVLQALIQRYDVISVVTQPDRPAGRNRQMQESPIKKVALSAGIPVFQPEKLRRKEAIEELKQWQPEVYVVAAFGQILPQAVLDIPPLGSINVHASLLPRWRGAAPIQAAIRAGDKESGITIMKMDAGLDTGPMLSQRAIPLAADETGQSLHDKLSLLGAELLSETLPRYLNGEIASQPQPEEGITLAPQIKKEEGHIDWTKSAVEIERLVRAFTPWPGTYTFWEGKLLKIIKGFTPPPDLLPAGREGEKDIGRVVRIREHVGIVTGESIFCPTRVQLEGKKAVTVYEFVRGHPSFVGAILE